jgi:hypothetical protein
MDEHEKPHIQSSYIVLGTQTNILKLEGMADDSSPVQGLDWAWLVKRGQSQALIVWGPSRYQCWRVSHWHTN